MLRINNINQVNNHFYQRNLKLLETHPIEPKQPNDEFVTEERNIAFGKNLIRKPQRSVVNKMALAALSMVGLGHLLTDREVQENGYSRAFAKKYIKDKYVLKLDKKDHKTLTDAFMQSPKLVSELISHFHYFKDANGERFKWPDFSVESIKIVSEENKTNPKFAYRLANLLLTRDGVETLAEWKIQELANDLKDNKDLVLYRQPNLDDTYSVIKMYQKSNNKSFIHSLITRRADSGIANAYEGENLVAILDLYYDEPEAVQKLLETNYTFKSEQLEAILPRYKKDKETIFELFEFQPNFSSRKLFLDSFPDIIDRYNEDAKLCKSLMRMNHYDGIKSEWELFKAFPFFVECQSMTDDKLHDFRVALVKTGMIPLMKAVAEQSQKEFDFEVHGLFDFKKSLDIQILTSIMNNYSRDQQAIKAINRIIEDKRATALRDVNRLIPVYKHYADKPIITNEMIETYFENPISRGFDLF